MVDSLVQFLPKYVDWSNFEGFSQPHRLVPGLATRGARVYQFCLLEGPLYL